MLQGIIKSVMIDIYHIASELMKIYVLTLFSVIFVDRIFMNFFIVGRIVLTSNCVFINRMLSCNM